MKAQHLARVEEGRRRLAAIDPRLAVPPAPNPFGEMVARGAPALDHLLTTAENDAESWERRINALQAVGAIFNETATDTGPGPAIGCRLLRLGTRGDAHPALRAAATRALVAGRHPEVMAACEKQLGSFHPTVVAASAHAMGVARRRQAVPALVALVAQEADPVAQAEAAWALGEIGDPQGLQALVDAFDRAGGTPPGPVLEALGKVGTMDTLDMLLARVGCGTAGARLSVAEAIVTLIERHGTEEHGRAKAVLAAAVERESDPLVAVLLLTALHRAGAQISMGTVDGLLVRSPGRPTLHAYLRRVFGRAVNAVRHGRTAAPNSESRGLAG